MRLRGTGDADERDVNRVLARDAIARVLVGERIGVGEDRQLARGHHVGRRRQRQPPVLTEKRRRHHRGVAEPHRLPRRHLPDVLEAEPLEQPDHVDVIGLGRNRARDHHRRLTQNAQERVRREVVAVAVRDQHAVELREQARVGGRHREPRRSRARPHIGIDREPHARRLVHHARVTEPGHVRAAGARRRGVRLNHPGVVEQAHHLLLFLAELVERVAAVEPRHQLAQQRRVRRTARHHRGRHRHVPLDDLDAQPAEQRALERLEPRHVRHRLEPTAARVVVGTVVPHVKIRIKTSKGQVALPSQRQVSVTPAPAKVAQSALELKHSTIAVIMRSRYREELDAIVNEALANSLFFEQLASDIENAGHEVVICLDLSLCEEVENSSKTFSGPIEKSSIARSLNPLARLLSDRDLDFLKSMKIKVSAS